MKKCIGLLLALVLIFSCSTQNESGPFTLPHKMPADEYVISVDRDTTLVTKNGALLKIPKGSLAVEVGSTVVLEIKEAYSIQQMIRANLFTQSNGAPLSSGGMIYINARGENGQKVTIRQAIKVAIPTDHLTDGMQLFKGEVTDMGIVNWTEPEALPQNTQLTQISKGKVLFESKCSSCHSIGKDATGPDLANILKRPHIFDEGGGYPLFHPFSEIRSIDTLNFYSPAALNYQCNVRKIYGSIGAPFPDLQVEISSIYRFIQNESNRNSLPMPSHAYLDSCIDSCRVYSERIGHLKQLEKSTVQKREQIIADNGEMTQIIAETTIGSTPANFGGSLGEFDNKVSPKNYNAVYYQFTVETFGWFNIDMLVEDLRGVKESELLVRVMGEYRESINIFLVIPSHKIFGEGGPTGNKPDEFAFFYKTGKLPLPQNEKAYIMAVTETSSSIAYAITEFNTGLSQQLEISLNPASKEEFNAAIQKLGSTMPITSVADSKNAEDIRRTDTALLRIKEEIKKGENLKPKSCDCHCGYSMDMPVTLVQ